MPSKRALNPDNSLTKRAKVSPASCKPQILMPQVYIVPTGIHAYSARMKIWSGPKAAKLGMQVITDRKQLALATHLVLQPGLSFQQLPQLVQQLLNSRGSSMPQHGGQSHSNRPLKVVSLTWLTACLEANALVATEDHLYQFAQPSSDLALTPMALARKACRPEYARWLGFWDPAFNNMTDDEIVMQGVYSVSRSKELGNEWLVALLKECRDYEEALANDYQWDEDAQAVKLNNHRGLRYARAAAVVRGCSYKLKAPVEQHDLPFCGGVTTVQINDMLRTGTTKVLDLFRKNEAVMSSSGAQRPESVGAAARRAFKKLPGVGVHTAKQWYMDYRCSTYEQVEAAASRRELTLSVAAAFSLKHRQDMLHTPEVDVQEMEEYVKKALCAVSESGWIVTIVGGGRRDAASHDADFVVTHPALGNVEGIMQKLVQWMIDDERLLPADQAMCMVQVGKMPSHISDLKTKILKKDLEGGAPQHNLAADRYDHVFGVYSTHAGRYRRLDVILVPYEEYAFGLMGWTGSRQYLRFLRQWSVRRLQMHCNAHAVARREGNTVLLVPSESAPYVKRNGQLVVAWPNGWHEGRKLECERDIFELLSLPWRESHERNA